MKQHITVEQLNKLSEKEKDRAREWVIQKLETNPSWNNVPLNEESLLLSIGQMIEFLLEKNPHRNYWFQCQGEVCCWFHPIESKHKELVDALWEAVKEVLEK